MALAEVNSVHGFKEITLDTALVNIFGDNKY